MDDIDTMLITLLGELDRDLTEGLDHVTPGSSQLARDSETDHLALGFSNLQDSLNELEDQDLDNVVADLTADLTTYQTLDLTTYQTPDLTTSQTLDLTTSQTPDLTTSQTPDLTTYQTPDLTTSQTPHLTTSQTPDLTTYQTPDLTTSQTPDLTTYQTPDLTTSQTPDLTTHLTPDLSLVQEHIPQQILPTTGSTSATGTTSTTATHRQGPPGPLGQGSPPTQPHGSEVQSKAEKIRLALEKLKEAKIRKLIVKVLMGDGSFKMLLVDGRQTVGGVLDVLFEKTHCDRAVDWSLCESNPELQIERSFEDHEPLVEVLCLWGRSSQNTVSFVSRPEKYALFKEPQVFYMWKTSAKDALSNTNEKEKKLLLKENFEGSSVIVPDLEGALYQKEAGKRKWNQRYLLLRASGIYYLPKGKTKSSIHLSCLVRFEHVNIYLASGFKQKYKAPTDFCFILKHPRLQQESDYIKFLCCEDEATLSLWVNSIRVAKYGAVLYKNYQAAVHRSATRTSTLRVSPYSKPAGASAAPSGRGEGQTIKKQRGPPQQPVCGAPDTPVSGASPSVLTGDFLSEPPPDFIPPAPLYCPTSRPELR